MALVIAVVFAITFWDKYKEEDANTSDHYHNDSFKLRIFMQRRHFIKQAGLALEPFRSVLWIGAANTLL